jgi:ABC-type transport system substrate-binding protein
MKSKKWLISLGLAVVLVVAFALPACETTPTEYWYTPESEKISFEISTIGGASADTGLMVTNDLKDFGLDVTHRVIDSTTFLQYLYEPNLGGMQVYIYGEDPSVDPWSDWIWTMLSDPEDWGYMWNPVWYNDERYNELYFENLVAPNLTAKEEILHEMQEILAEDLPLFYLVRPDFIAAYRTDHWENWHNQLGGPVSWINEYSIREVTAVGDATQLGIGGLTMMPNRNMDPEVLMYTNIGCLYLMIVYENLAGFPKVDEDSLEADPDAAYDFVPKLATGYNVTYEDDGEGGENQIWTITLREGVKWHDYETSGENLTAGDVVYSMKYAVNKWDWTKPIDWVAVEEDTEWDEILPEHVLVEANGDYTVKFTYIDGYHLTDEYVPNWWLWDPIVPEHIFEADEREPLEWDGYSIGTGPFKMAEFETDDHMLLERFDGYWGDLPDVQQVMHKRYDDPGAMFLALESGVIDTVEDTALQHMKISTFEADENIEVEIVPGLTVNYLGFNLHPDMGYEPLQDKVLRQAIAYAINNQDIVNIIYGGYAEIPDGFIYRESPMHNPDLPQYEFDLTTARDMLLAANYTFHAEE